MVHGGPVKLEAGGWKLLSLTCEFDRHPLRDQAAIERVTHQALEAFPATLTVRQRAVVHVVEHELRGHVGEHRLRGTRW